MINIHRRNQKSQSTPSSPRMMMRSGSEPKFTKSRTPSFSFLTNRIGMIFVCILLIIGFMHFILPSYHRSDSDVFSGGVYSNANLKPKNYLNTSELDFGKNPFEFCPAYGPGDRVGQKYGSLALGQSRLHLGSSIRIQRVISKALAGQPITISVLGGSGKRRLPSNVTFMADIASTVSACHGAGDDPISPACYPSRFFQWWNTVFPHPSSELTNGALRTTNSAYFAYCSAHHIPDVTDLIIVELDASDPPTKETTDHFEVLIRSLLLRPDSPAVLLLGHFSPQLYGAHGAFGAEHLHGVVAQFYDVPHVTTKSLLLIDYMRDPTSISRYYADPILANPSGHEIMADVLIAYFQTQICNAWGVVTGSLYESTGPAKGGAGGAIGGGAGLFGGVGQRKGVPEPKKQQDRVDVDHGVEVDAEGNRIHLGLPDFSNPLMQGMNAHAPVPPKRMNTPLLTTYEEINPFCVSANDLVNPLPPSLFAGTGWNAFHPPQTGGGSSMNSKAHYWYSTLSGSRIRIPVQIGGGDVGVYYLVGPDNGAEGSEIECWVDDNYPGAKTLRNRVEGAGEDELRFTMIDHFVTRGSHFVECQVKGEEGQGVEVFKVMGVFTT
uniref:Capsular associated protein n=1 Tax=Moniliophthora roreri TaxID=221103 RepID=A0A0W0F2L5_MONRR